MDKKVLEKQFATYVFQQIKEKKLFENESDFTATNLKKYFVKLIEQNREGKIFEALKIFFIFNGTARSLEEQIQRIQESSKTKSLENFFKEKSTPVLDTLLFLATVFEIPIQNLDDFHEYLENNAAKKESKINQNSDNQVVSKKRFIPKNQVLMAAFSVLALFLAIFFYQKYTSIQDRFQNARHKIEHIESLAFSPKPMPDNMIEKDSSKKNTQKNTIQEKKVELTNGKALLYFTNNIYNKSFIYSQQKWGFATDKNGEDMNSLYGEPYNQEIRHLKPEKLLFPTIANKEMHIRFNIKNITNEKLFLDNMYIKILEKYVTNSETMFYNAWLPKLSEEKYQIEINNSVTIYPFSLYLEVEPHQSQHFSFQVKTAPNFTHQIARFSIEISANNGNGKRYVCSSDKNYLVGFLEE